MNTPPPTPAYISQARLSLMEDDSPDEDFDPAVFDELEPEQMQTSPFDDFAIRDRWYDRLPSPLRDLPPPVPPKAARGTKRRRVRPCSQIYCRMEHGHSGDHSAVAERYIKMSPKERSKWLRKGNAARSKARADAKAKPKKSPAYCQEPLCNKLLNHPPPHSSKVKFVRCPVKYCHKAVNHDGEHSKVNAKTKAEAIARMVETKASRGAMVHGRDIGVQTDLGITGQAK